MARQLQDKVIVITGASAGIGEAVAVACAKAGMHAVLGARRQEKLDEVAAGVEKLGRKALAVPCDVTRDGDVADLFDRAFTQMGRVDVVFANAGYGLYGSVLETTDQDHRAIFETNYFGTIRAIQAGVPCLAKTYEGLKHVIVCSSSASEIGVPMMGPYCATKAAQDAIVSSLRAELARDGFAVTGVHPVGTSSSFFDVAAEVSGQEQHESNTPVPLMQTPHDVARAIVKAIRRPRPEVWPMAPARLALALATAAPSFGAWIMRRHAKKVMP